MLISKKEGHTYYAVVGFRSKMTNYAMQSTLKYRKRSLQYRCFVKAEEYELKNTFGDKYRSYNQSVARCI